MLHTGDVVGFAFRQPVVVADLAMLRGPLTGVWRLPRTLDSSALQSRDLADPAARQLAYEVVLREAADERDITEWVDRDGLLRLWSRLYLPRQVRASWEEHHAVLREIGAGPDVPRAYQAATAAGSGLLDERLKHVSGLDPFHADVARIALAATQRLGYALAGENALAAHGLLARATEDLDLFTTTPRATNAAVLDVTAALTAAGYDVQVLRAVQPGGEFASLLVTRADGPAVTLDLGRDARDHPPARVVLERGLPQPVLDLEDLIASKVAALLSRGAARDYIDVTTVHDRFGTQYDQDALLLRLAFARDAGLPTADAATAARRLDRLPDSEFATYGLSPTDVRHVREAFAAWSRDPDDAPVADAAHQAVHPPEVGGPLT